MPFLQTYSPQQQQSHSGPQEEGVRLLPDTGKSRAGNNPELEAICILKVQFIPLHPFSVIPHVPIDTSASSGAHLLENTSETSACGRLSPWVQVDEAVALV